MWLAVFIYNPSRTGLHPGHALLSLLLDADPLQHAAATAEMATQTASHRLAGGSALTGADGLSRT